MNEPHEPGEMRCRWCDHVVAATVVKGGLRFQVSRDDQVTELRRHVAVAHRDVYRRIRVALQAPPVPWQAGPPRARWSGE